jgi:hypothetical protein
MAESMIVCPNCKQNIPLTNAIEGPIAERLRKEFEAKSQAKEHAILELEKSVLAQRVELNKARQAQEIEIQTKLAAERHKLAAEAKQSAEAAIATQVADLRSQLTEQSKKLESAQATELELRKERRELEQQKEALALEVTRRVDEECGKIKLETRKTLEEEYQRKEKDRLQQLEALRVEVAASQRRAETLAAKEQSLAAEKAKLDQLQQSMEAQVAEKLNAERQKLTAEALQRATEQKAVEMQDLQQRLAEKDTRLQQAQQLEITLRNERVKLEEQKRELELQTIRQLDEERAKIRESATRAADENHRLKEREAEEKMAAMRRQIEELRQKAEQGSQQLQGEVLELELEDMLRAAFPHDVVEPVPKGVHGGDVVQKVMTPALQYCGTILWESKRTKNWSDGFIEKLKDDQRKAKADVAMIVSVTLPKTVVHFGNMDGIWVTSRECMMPTVSALRTGLLQLAGARRAAEGQHEKMQVLYRYVSSHEFKQRVEGVVEAFLAMKEELDKERTAITKIWAKREKQIERVMESTTGLVGDIAGIVGGAMPAIPSMELPALAEPAENGSSRLR